MDIFLTAAVSLGVLGVALLWVARRRASPLKIVHTATGVYGAKILVIVCSPNLEDEQVERLLKLRFSPSSTPLFFLVYDHLSQYERNGIRDESTFLKVWMRSSRGFPQWRLFLRFGADGNVLVRHPGKLAKPTWRDESRFLDGSVEHFSKRDQCAEKSTEEVNSAGNVDLGALGGALSKSRRKVDDGNYKEIPRFIRSESVGADHNKPQ